MKTKHIYKQNTALFSLRKKMLRTQQKWKEWAKGRAKGLQLSDTSCHSKEDSLLRAAACGSSSAPAAPSPFPRVAALRQNGGAGLLAHPVIHMLERCLEMLSTFSSTQGIIKLYSKEQQTGRTFQQENFAPLKKKNKILNNTLSACYGLGTVWVLCTCSVNIL